MPLGERNQSPPITIVLPSYAYNVACRVDCLYITIQAGLVSE